MVLEVFTDPEAEATLRDLFAHIQSPFPPDETLRRLRQFDDDWWLNALDAANGNLTISVEPG